ncbi:MAG: phosphoribosyltransferase family protein [Actinomycetota bacterium]
MSDWPSGAGAAALRRAVEERGRIEGSLVKVDEFLNHRVEPELMAAIGADLATRFSVPDVVLTAEASGIAPALQTAAAFGVPMVYAKKYPRAHSDRPAFVREVGSPTKGAEYRVEVAHRVLPAGSRVLIIDDFLSGGRTAEALGEIVEEAGGTVTGFGFVIEKAFVAGRSKLEARGWRVESLLRILSLDGRIVLEPW